MKIGKIGGARNLLEMFGGNHPVSSAGHLCPVCWKPLGAAVVKTAKGDVHPTCVEVHSDGRIVPLPSQLRRLSEPDQDDQGYWDWYLEQCREQQRRQIQRQLQKQLQELLRRQNTALFQQQISSQLCSS